MLLVSTLYLNENLLNLLFVSRKSKLSMKKHFDIFILNIKLFTLEKVDNLDFTLSFC